MVFTDFCRPIRGWRNMGNGFRWLTPPAEFSNASGVASARAALLHLFSLLGVVAITITCENYLVRVAL